jgi:tetratricopeptide (TPR) repeat protein
VELTLKKISKSGVAEAISKAQLYRYLNEPEETESICKDILAVDPDNQMALRMLGLAITDEFSGQSSDRYAEAEQIFGQLSDPYERHYYAGILHERRAKAQMRAGRPTETLVEQFSQAMRHFEQAEEIRPPENDDAVLRWNRCIRLLERLPRAEREQEATFDDQDSAPVGVIRRKIAS